MIEGAASGAWRPREDHIRTIETNGARASGCVIIVFLSLAGGSTGAIVSRVRKLISTSFWTQLISFDLCAFVHFIQLEFHISQTTGLDTVKWFFLLIR